MPLDTLMNVRGPLLDDYEGNDFYIEQLLSDETGKYTDLICSRRTSLTGLFNDAFPQFGTYRSRFEYFIGLKHMSDIPLNEISLVLDVVNGLNLVTTSESFLVDSLDEKVDELSDRIHYVDRISKEHKNVLELNQFYRFLRGKIKFNDLFFDIGEFKNLELDNSVWNGYCRNLLMGSGVIGFFNSFNYNEDVSSIALGLGLLGTILLGVNYFNVDAPYQLRALKEKCRRSDLFLDEFYRTRKGRREIEIFD